MLGLMQSRALTTAMLIDHAVLNHGPTGIVSVRADGAIERSTWAGVGDAARRIAAALAGLGLERGERIATLAWNRTAHLQLYFGVTAGGFVLHTVNPRLFEAQIEFIVRDGGARVVCVDPDLLPLLEAILPRLEAVEQVIVLCAAGEMPETSIPTPIALGDLLDRTAPVAEWPEVDETTASTLCYTSGTTGNPKGVLYSHRSTVLHSYAIVAPDAMGLSACDSILLATPLFHVNAWGVPFAAAMCGAKLVMPGPRVDGASLYALMRDEGITFSLAVPTVWFGLIDHLESHVPRDACAALSLRRIFCGGTALPRTLAERLVDRLGIEVIQAWGMTETSPVATVSRPLAKHASLDADGRTMLATRQGRPLCGVEIRIEDGAGVPIDRGSDVSGLLKVRGPWIASAYFGDPDGSAVDRDGWFDTGDIARIDGDGFLQLTDRAKDVIKSGGEWISSIDLENAAVSHPAVAEAAVIGVAHPRWQERPLLLVVPERDMAISRDDMLAYLAPRVARWWLPDDVVSVDALPHGPTGKLQKAELRVAYRDHLTG